MDFHAQYCVLDFYIDWALDSEWPQSQLSVLGWIYRFHHREVRENKIWLLSRTAFQIPCNSAFPSLSIAVSKSHMAHCPANFATNSHWLWQNAEQWGTMGSSWQKSPQGPKKKTPYWLCVLLLCARCVQMSSGKSFPATKQVYFPNPSFCSKWSKWHAYELTDQ